MVWGEVVSKSSEYLEAKGVPDARVASECLAARLLRLGRGFLAGALEKGVSPACVEAMRRGLARLVKGEPLQYVLGEWDFRTLTLGCDRRALIPRPETEGLVDLALRRLKGQARPRVVDVGTGTGAIILSLAKEFTGDGIFIGTDISTEALALAAENAARHGLTARVKFVCMDGLDDFDEPQCLDMIVSNPPYVTSAECEALDARVRDWEPRLALDGGVTGLDFYDRYLADALNLLRPGGSVLFEIGETQGEAVRELMFDYGFDAIEILSDLASRPRYAVAVLP